MESHSSDILLTQEVANFNDFSVPDTLEQYNKRTILNDIDVDRKVSIDVSHLVSEALKLIKSE